MSASRCADPPGYRATTSPRSGTEQSPLVALGVPRDVGEDMADRPARQQAGAADDVVVERVERAREPDVAGPDAVEDLGLRSHRAGG